MNNDNQALLIEIRDLLKLLADGQKQLERDIKDLREEHRKLREEVRMSNIVLNNMNTRSEIMN